MITILAITILMAALLIVGVIIAGCWWLILPLALDVMVIYWIIKKIRRK